MWADPSADGRLGSVPYRQTLSLTGSLVLPRSQSPLINQPTTALNAYRLTLCWQASNPLLSSFLSLHASLCPRLAMRFTSASLIDLRVSDLPALFPSYVHVLDLYALLRFLLQGTLRLLLVLLHDFPEFLCDYHYAFCDVIPPNCIQMRNLILSAFPRNMRLPDPFTPNLKVKQKQACAPTSW